MKKQTQKSTLFVLISFILISTSGFSQTCRIASDSITAGSRASSYSEYIYDSSNRLAQIAHVDSGSLQTTTMENMYYNSGNGLIEQIEIFNTVGTPTLARRIKYEFSGSVITRVNASGTNNQGAWKMSHDITYSGSNLQSIELIPDSLLGSPDGLAATFADIVYQSGNIVSLNLLIGGDTVELTVTTDAKNNLQQKLPGSEGASDLLFATTAGNILQVATVNNENVPGLGAIPAGSKFIDRTLTYNGNNDVETVTENPSVFENRTSTTLYTYDCTNGIISAPEVQNISLTPNPAGNVINIENGSFKGVVKIFDLSGRQIVSMKLADETSSLNVSDLIPGIYFIEISNGQKIYRGKFSKE